jgi:hypothetical protein
VGNHTLKVAKAGYTEKSVTNVNVAGGKTTNLGTIILTPLVSTASVKGTVVDEYGNPLSGVSVQLRARTDGRLAANSTTVNGMFNLTKLSPGNYTLTASFRGYENASLNLTLQPGDEKVLRIMMSLHPSGPPVSPPAPAGMYFLGLAAGGAAALLVFAFLLFFFVLRPKKRKKLKSKDEELKTEKGMLREVWMEKLRTQAAAYNRRLEDLKQRYEKVLKERIEAAATTATPVASGDIILQIENYKKELEALRTLMKEKEASHRKEIDELKIEQVLLIRSEARKQRELLKKEYEEKLKEKDAHLVEVWQGVLQLAEIVIRLSQEDPEELKKVMFELGITKEALEKLLAHAEK